MQCSIKTPKAHVGTVIARHDGELLSPPTIDDGALFARGVLRYRVHYADGDSEDVTEDEVAEWRIELWVEKILRYVSSFKSWKNRIIMTTLLCHADQLFFIHQISNAD